MKKYILNPDYPADQVRCNGVTITRKDVLEGDKWFEGTKQPFENIPPILVVAPEESESTIVEPEVRAPQHPSIEEIASRPNLSLVPDDVPDDVPEVPEEEEAPEIEEKEDEPTEPVLDPDEAESSEEDDDDDDEYEEWELTDIKGVGDSRAGMLVEAGYKDVEEVAKADPESLMKAVRDLGKPLNLATARSIVKGAKSLLED